MNKRFCRNFFSGSNDQQSLKNLSKKIKLQSKREQVIGIYPMPGREKRLKILVELKWLKMFKDNTEILILTIKHFSYGKKNVKRATLVVIWYPPTKKSHIAKEGQTSIRLVNTVRQLQVLPYLDFTHL